MTLLHYIYVSTMWYVQLVFFSNQTLFFYFRLLALNRLRFAYEIGEEMLMGITYARKNVCAAVACLLVFAFFVSIVRLSANVYDAKAFSSGDRCPSFVCVTHVNGFILSTHECVCANVCTGINENEKQ